MELFSDVRILQLKMFYEFEKICGLAKWPRTSVCMDVQPHCLVLTYYPPQLQGRFANCRGAKEVSTRFAKCKVAFLKVWTEQECHVNGI